VSLSTITMGPPHLGQTQEGLMCWTVDVAVLVCADAESSAAKQSGRS